MFSGGGNRILSFKSLTKMYHNTKAVEDFTLDVSKGEFVVLIGPSGCGKSTTLRMVNRLVEASSGTIHIDGQDYKNISPVDLRRRLGYVIQQIGLMPHLTIGENISFVLKLQRIAKSKRRERATELLRVADLDPEIYLDRYPRELSGGQQQRIGVLRALAHDPDIILMDEPFGALDPITREQLQDELKRLQRTMHKTILFVTHDMDEALKLADRIVIMKNGKVVQIASPEEMLRHPANEFVTDFIGRQRLLRQASDVLVKDIMNPQPVKMLWESGLAQTLETMRRRRVDSIMVVDDDEQWRGLVFLNEIQTLLKQGVEKPIGELVKLSEVNVLEDDTVLSVVHRMLTHRLDAIPVTDNSHRLTGVVTRGTFVGVISDVLSATEDRSAEEPIHSYGEGDTPLVETNILQGGT